MKRSKIISIIFSFLIMLGLSLSCSSPQDVTGLIPYAFQGMWIDNGMGNPDTAVQLDTTLPGEPSQFIVYQIEKIGESEASYIANKFGLKNNPVPFNPSSPNAKRTVYSYTDNSKTLEVYPIGRFVYRNSQNSINSPIKLPAETECIDIAKKGLQSIGMYPDSVVRITTGTISSIANVSSESSQSPVYQPTSFMVSFISDINGYERYSPSADVILGDQGKMVQLTVYDPKLKEYGTTALKSAENALNIMKSYLTNPSFNPPETKECITNPKGFQRLSILKVSLKYYSLDNIGYMQPIWVFEGEAFNSRSPNPEKFIGRVDAVAHQNP
jgi:hypothetical protein